MNKISEKLFYNIIFFSIFALFLVATSFNIWGPDSNHYILYGKEIIETGTIPHYSSHVIYDNFHIILQEWLWDAIFYKLWLLNPIALNLFQAILMGFIFGTVFFFLKKKNCSNFHVLISVSIIFLLLTYGSYLRPMNFTILVLLILFGSLRKFAETNNTKWLFTIPVLTLIEINVHASHWIFIYLFILTFLVPGFKIKGAKLNTYKINRKKLLSMTVLSLPVLLLNPYGAGSVTYIFKALFVISKASIISECDFVHIFTVNFAVTLVLLFILALLIINEHANSMEIYLIAGLATAALLMERNFVFIPFAFLTVFLNKDVIKFLKILEDDVCYRNIMKHKGVILSGFIVGGLIILLVTLNVKGPFEAFNQAKNYDNAASPKAAVMYMNEHSKSKTVFNDSDSGTFLELNGYKIFIDYSFESYSKKLNKVHDSLSEYTNIMNNNAYVDEIDKYEYALCTNSKPLYKVIKRSSNWKEVVINPVYTLFENQYYDK